MKMGEEFHKNRVQTNCCLICGPTKGPLRNISTNLKLSTALNMFLDLDLNDPNLPPNCCDGCRSKYIKYYERNRRSFSRRSPEEIAEHRNELQKRNVYPLFPYSPHTEDNCQICEASLSIEDTANEPENSGPVHDIPPSYSHPNRNRNEPERLGDWNMTQITTRKTFLSQRDPLATPKQQIEATPIAKTVTNFILPTKTYSKKPSTPKNLSFVSCTPTKPNEAIDSNTPLIFNQSQLSTTPHVLKIKKPVIISPKVATDLSNKFSKQHIVLKMIKPVTIAPKVSSTASTHTIPEKLKKIIDLPTSKPLSTVLTLPLPDLDSPINLPKTSRNPFKESNSLSSSFINEVTSEPLDDTIDPLKQAADEISPNEPVGELLKIVTNLPLGDQVLFIKLLVLQLNDDMLSLVKKLVNTLEQGNIFDEDMDNVLDLIPGGSDVIDVKEELYESDQLEEVNKSTNSKVDEEAKTETVTTLSRMVENNSDLVEPTEEILVKSDTFVKEVVNHQALEISMRMKKDMMDLVKSDPVPPVAQQRKLVQVKYNEQYGKLNPQLWKDIKTSIGSNASLDEMLDLVRNKPVGYDQPPTTAPKVSSTATVKAMEKEMVDLVKNDPIPPVRQKRELVIDKYREKYQKLNPRMWMDIMRSLGSSSYLDSMLEPVRTELVGYDQPPEISMEMKNEMVELVKNDPKPPVGPKRKYVFEKYQAKYQKSNPRMWMDIMVSFGENADMDEMLNSLRTELVGPDRPPVADNMFACSKCDQIFDCPKKRRRHQDRHNEHFESSVVCEKCSKILKTKTGWKEHMKLHEEENSQEKNIQCDECPKRFHLELLFRRHKQWKHAHAEVVCEKCGKTCSSIHGLKRHDIIKHSDPTKPKPFPCDQCPSAFFLKINLNHHKKRHSDSYSKPFACNKCERTCKSPAELKEHQACHGNERNYKCKECDKTFKFGSTLHKHFKVQHSLDLPHQCDICDKRFPIAALLRVHKLSHLDESEWPFACDKCGRRFKLKQSMLFHIKKKCSIRKTIPGTRKVECNICGKPVDSRNLEDHLSTHTFERPYSCEECKKSFKTQSSLKNHYKLHSKSFHCEQCPKVNKHVHCIECQKAFSKNSSLKEHILSAHSSVKPYSCEECSKSFATKALLEIHVKTHEKSIHCELCPKAFSRSCELRDHLRTHTGEKPYSCDQCSKTFTLKRPLKLHKEKCHSEIGEIILELDPSIFYNQTNS